MKIKAIYPGTFDPITAGHEDLVKRASNIFESVIVAVASNTQKNTLFSYDERYAMCSKVLSKYKNVDVSNITFLNLDFFNNFLISNVNGHSTYLKNYKLLKDVTQNLIFFEKKILSSLFYTSLYS